MKISRIGWVGKTMDFPVIWSSKGGYFEVDGIYAKGKKKDWRPEDWPPRRVLVTVEDVE